MRTSAIRKTFSGPTGRPRRAGLREPNGRIQRAPKVQTEAEIVSLVLRQPHRRDLPQPRTQRAVSLIGRLIEAGAVKHADFSQEALAEAAERYLGAYGRYQAAVASRRPLAVLSGSGAIRVVDEAAEAERHQKAVAAWVDVSRVLRIAGQRVEQAVDAAVLHSAPDRPETELAAWVVLSLSAGLGALCRYYGLGGRNGG